MHGHPQRLIRRTRTQKHRHSLRHAYGIFYRKIVGDKPHSQFNVSLIPCLIVHLYIEIYVRFCIIVPQMRCNAYTPQMDRRLCHQRYVLPDAARIDERIRVLRIGCGRHLRTIRQPFLTYRKTVPVIQPAFDNLFALGLFIDGGRHFYN